ncbi:MAG TPA: sugar transferase [Candidatus Dormibacteraeota bacterium]|nr:sugar transferase [Candidatus Dormibacteraeota bacterium]
MNLLTDSEPLLRARQLAGTSRNRLRRALPVIALRVVGDGLAVAAGALIGFQYRFYLSGVPIPGNQVPSFQAYLLAVPVVAALWVLTFAFTARYRVHLGQSFVDEILGSAGSVALFVVVALALEGLYRGFPYSRLVLADAAVAALLLFVGERALIRLVQGALLRSGFGGTRVLVVGSGPVADLLLRRLRMFPEYGYQVVGKVGTEPEAASDHAGDDLPRFSLDAGLPRLIARERADTVLLALSGVGHDRVLELVREGLGAGAEVKVVPDVLEVMTSAASTEEVAGLPLVGLRPNRLIGGNLWIKRGFDLIAAGLLSIVAVPVVALSAAAIAITSPGSPFYRQERLGRDGRPFQVWKLRSMVRDAERGLGPVMTEVGDQRRTPVGRFVRRYSIDELPQLWNVLVGDMSLVGPRPERQFFADQFEESVPRYRERLQVKPGCTGWAQVNDLRQASSMEERVFYDIYYVENWSISFDLKILLLTPWRLLFHRHAY